jgi:hypothetical protein
MNAWIADRTLMSAAMAGGVALVLRARVPWLADDPILVLVAVYRPALYRTRYVAYLTLLFSTPYLVSSVLWSLAYIFVNGRAKDTVPGRLPPYPAPEGREQLFVVLGEQHHPLKPIPVETPTWLTIPERGLFTGIAVIGAVGSGKTTGCLHPYADQVLGYRRTDPQRRIGGLVLEVKGDQSPPRDHCQ